MRFLLFLSYLMTICTKPVYLALKQHNIHVLKARLNDISDPYSVNYGKFLSRSEIDSLIKPADSHINIVIDWIRAYNTSNIKNYGDNIKFEAEPDVIAKMFNQENIKTSYEIPLNLRETIEFVEMEVKPFPRNIKTNLTARSSVVDNRYFGRESLVKLYNLSSYPSIKGDVSGGPVEYQSNPGFENSDLNLQQLGNNQSVKNVSIVVGNGTGSDVESELDVQLISQAADGLNLWYWETPYWLYSFAVDFYGAADVPDVVSMSWGWAEDQQCDIISCNNITSRQYVERVNNEYLKIALRGTTILVSSGDAGAPGRTSESCSGDRPINPVFPGSSPYVLSIGATYVNNGNSSGDNFTSGLCSNHSCVEGTNESSITFDAVGWTAGGGFDIYHNETFSWQKDAVESYLFSGVTLPNYKNFNPFGRAYPDVSAVGHSCPTYIDGYLSGVDGTSCSAPVVAGLLSLVNDYLWSNHRIKLGYANPLIYDIAKTCSGCFNDITKGHNWCTEEQCCDNRTEYGFLATKGYDPVSGLGTLNIGKIIHHLNTQYNFSKY